MRTKKMGRMLAAAGIAVLALAVAPGGAAAAGKGKQLGKLAAKQCAKEKKAIGNEAFTELYGKPAMPNCIGVTKPDVSQATKNAAKECKAEREEIGAEAFADKYGANKNKRNAFGKCVSGKRGPELAADRAEKVNAANECKAERGDPAFGDSHEGQTFEQFYGTNKNGKNAFGKCVSGKVNATA